MRPGPDGVYRVDGPPRMSSSSDRHPVELGTPGMIPVDELKKWLNSEELRKLLKKFGDAALIPIELLDGILSKLGAAPKAALLAYVLYQVTERDQRADRSRRGRRR
jgi:hypothetical protein